MAQIDSCKHCGSREIYHHRNVYANWSTELQLLPGIHAGKLGLSPAKFDVYVCTDCGNTEFFVQEEYLQKVREKWTRVGTELPVRE